MYQGFERGRSAIATGTRRVGRALRPEGKVLPEHARSHNRSLVLQQLYHTSGLSRADIARMTGLTRVTVSDLVSEMIVEGIVMENGQREDARPGKPATLLDINPDAFHIVAVDLSEKTRFRGVLVNLRGDIIVRSETPQSRVEGDAAVECLMSLIDELQQSTTSKILGIGVGSPGVVDTAGVVRNAPNLRWKNLPLQSILNNRFRVPVTVANDANAAVLAEHSFSDSAQDLILIQVGAGVGAGLIVDGSPIIGAGEAAGEIGHVVVGTDGGPECACGKNGCLEAWLSVPNLRAQLGQKPTEKEKERVLGNAGQRLGIALAPVIATLNVSEVVLSGPRELLGGPLKESASETLRQRMMPEIHGDLRLSMTTLGQDIVLRGAAVLVLLGQLGIS
ncbi:ROK family transcriptional regulator [Lysinibacter sp. HNR]|uniref:ROK family transcriptional regulator n=1 Tax=Lysinibacter sp. HNR TaxID=3031408 RepID=UPI002435F28E|nr:ROK family transcriptional regulator [Lysinibacter sp. HNR]WGD38013.1 ROK family transcriptional regulator [Lysinibacter sp. HNR]